MASCLFSSSLLSPPAVGVSVIGDFIPTSCVSRGTCLSRRRMLLGVLLRASLPFVKICDAVVTPGIHLALVSGSLFAPVRMDLVVKGKSRHSVVKGKARSRDQNRIGGLEGTYRGRSSAPVKMRRRSKQGKLHSYLNGKLPLLLPLVVPAGSIRKCIRGFHPHHKPLSAGVPASTLMSGAS